MNRAPKKWLVTLVAAAILLMTAVCRWFYPSTLIVVVGCVSALFFVVVCRMLYFQPHHKPQFLQTLDDILSGSVWRQFVAFLVVVALILGAGCAFVLVTSGGEGYGDKIWDVVQLFLDPGHLSQGGQTAVKGVSLLIVLSGMVFMSGLLISTITNIIERRVEQVEKGLAVYKKIAGHYVIVGYGELASCIIREIIRKELTADKPDRLPKIVLLTSQNAETVRAAIASQIDKQYMRKIVIYSGDIESAEHIAHLNIRSAKEIFVLGERFEYGRDSKNLACLKQIAYLREPNPAPLKVNIQFDRIPSYSIVQKLTLSPDYLGQRGKSDIYFRPFNFHENWARLLWSYYALTEDGKPCYDPLDFEAMTGTKHVHLVIVGFNSMGRALLLEALRLCHYPNFDEHTLCNKTRITVVDKDMDAQLPFFRSQYPHLDQIADIDIEYRAEIAESEPVRQMLDASARDASTLLTVAVCLCDPDLSLATGLNLPESIYYQPEGVTLEGRHVTQNRMRPRVLIRQELKKGLGDILDRDEMRYKHVRIFGMCEQGISEALLNDPLAMVANADYAQDSELHIPEIYRLYRQGDHEGIKLRMERIRTLWAGLSENMRWANRYQIDMYGQYLKLLREEGITQQSQMETLSNDLLIALSRIEHLRWNAERSVSGWRQAAPGEKRVEEFQVHTQIIPYYELHDKEQLKDRRVVSNALMLNEMSEILSKLV